MTEHFFNHDRLDAYRLSMKYVASAFNTSQCLEGLHRHARDQWLRAAQSILLNIAVVSGGLSRETDRDLKSRLVRIVAMLTRMAMKFDSVSESSSEYNHAGDYEHEHRDAEHEHEEEPEPSGALEALDRPS